jgi:hypothetical protein
MKKHVDPNMEFLFQDAFSVGIIHGENTRATTSSSKEVVEIQDDKDYNISICMMKTSSRAQSEVVVRSRLVSGFNPVSSPTTNSTHPGAAGGGLENPASNRPAGRAVGGPIGK